MDSRSLQLADNFTSAAIDPSQWMSALMGLAEATGSARGQLIGIGGDATIPFNWVNDFSETAYDEFYAMDGGNPLINPRVAASIDAPLLGVRSEGHYDFARKGLTSEIYLDFCKDYDIPYGCQCNLFGNGEGIVGLAVLRTEQEGYTSSDQRRLFEEVAPYVRSAVRTQMALERDGPRLLAGALDAVSAAVFICTHDGQVAAKTGAAETLLSSGRLSISGGTLRTPHHADQHRLHKVIARHAGSVPLPLESVILTGRPGQTPLILDIVTAPRKNWSMGFLPHVLVIARGTDRWHGSSEAILRGFYGLSHAEADVALRLAQGQPRAIIAQERGARLETIRSQIKSIFTKLGVAREIEFAAMMAQMLRY